MKKHLIIAALFVATAISSAKISHILSVKPNSVAADASAFNLNQYIVHGDKLENIKASLSTLGIKPTYQYDTIDAVAVLLSEQQKQAIERSNAKLHFFAENDLSISSNTASSSNTPLANTLKFLTKSNAVSWQVENIETGTKELASLFIEAPTENGSIESILINGENVLFHQTSENEIALLGYVDLKPNKATNVVVEFSTLANVDRTNYALSLAYSDGIVNATKGATGEAIKTKDVDTYYPKLVNAKLVHEMGYTGQGVTVAIIDTGYTDSRHLKTNANNKKRHITEVNVLTNSERATDDNGHGAHLTSLIANAQKNPADGYNGIAPNVNLVSIKAFDAQGRANYTDILKAVEYVIENKDVLNIKVLNLSFSAMPSSYYWDDPLNKAIMRAWQVGITVIAAAGNRGPDAMTIGVPGNTPYVITVGAVSDNFTPGNLNDDYVTTFSSAGPTYEGFVKPELVAPGGHIKGIMDKNSLLRKTYSIFDSSKKQDYFALSGSSQSAAITTGIVALMLEANPNLSPDDVKCRLISTAKAATSDDGSLAFSIFQQGAGLVDAFAAVTNANFACANNNMDIEKDLSGEAHYIGPVRRHENEGDYYIPSIEGLEWSGVYGDSQLWRFSSDSQLWRNTGFNSNSQLWRHTSFSSNSQLWRNTGFSADSQLWRNTGFSADSQLWRGNSFNSSSQLWRGRSFSSNSILNDWVDHE